MANSKKKPHCGQDKWLVKQAKEIARLKQRLANDTQEVYACFCKVLNDQYGWTFEQISELFTYTEKTWQQCIEENKVDSMVEWCEKSTDFSVLEGHEDEQEAVSKS